MWAIQGGSCAHLCLVHKNHLPCQQRHLEVRPLPQPFSCLAGSGEREGTAHPPGNPWRKDGGPHVCEDGGDRPGGRGHL